LENTQEVVAKFERKMNTKIRKQERIEVKEEKNFKRGELPKKYTAKMLYGWNDVKFEKEDLRKLERSWKRWKSVFLEKKP